MIIKKDKEITIKIAVLYALGLVFLTILTYVLGWLEQDIETHDYTTLLFFFLIIIGEIMLCIIVVLPIIFCNKKYYEVTEDGIKLFNRTELVFELSKDDITSIRYIRFRWGLLMQFGAGGLHFEYVGNDNIKPTFAMKDSWKVYSISVSYKQAVKISEILKKPIILK